MATTFLRTALASLLIATAAPVLAEGAGNPAATEIRAGSLVLTEGFSRATLPGAPVAGGFLSIANSSDAGDRLVAASSAVAGRMEVHETTLVDDVMQMRELADGLSIPAYETVVLRPGSYHIMFMELKQPLVEGETVDVTLTFEHAGEVTVPLAVLAPDAEGAATH